MNLFKKGILWNLVRTILQRGLVFIQQIVLAWYLIPEEFGLFSSISSILALCSFFSVFGLNEIITNRFKSINFWEKIFNSVNYLLIIVSFIFYLVFSILIHDVDLKFFYSLLIYGISIFANGLQTIDLVRLNVKGDYYFTSFTKICYSILLVFTSIILAVNQFGILSLFISSTLASSFEFLLLRIRSRSSFSFSKSFRKIKILILSSINLTGYNLSWRSINYLDFVILSFFLGDKKAGLYFMAFNLSVQPLNIFVSYIPGILFSSNIRDELNFQETNERVQKTTLILIFLTAPIFFGQFFFSEKIIDYLFNIQWQETSDLLKILSIAMIPRVLSSQWAFIPLVQSRYLYLSKLSFYYLILFLLLFIVGTYYFELYGGVLAILIFYCLTIYMSKNYLIKSNKYLLETILIILYGFISFLLFYDLKIFENDLTNFFSIISLSLIFYFFTIFITCNKTRKMINQLSNFNS